MACSSASPTASGTQVRAATSGYAVSWPWKSLPPVGSRPVRAAKSAMRSTVGGVERPVVDLDARQPPVDEPRDVIGVVGSRGRVGQDRQAAGVPDGVDRLTWSDALARHVGGPARDEPAVERILDGCGVPGQDERLPHVGSTTRCGGRQAERRELIVDGQCPGRAGQRGSGRCASRAQRRWRAQQSRPGAGSSASTP